MLQGRELWVTEGWEVWLGPQSRPTDVTRPLALGYGGVGGLVRSPVPPDGCYETASFGLRRGGGFG